MTTGKSGRKFEFTIFHKIILFIVLLLIPIIALYIYSNNVAVSVVQNEIQLSIQRRLSYFQSRVDAQLDDIARSAFQISDDPTMYAFANNNGFGDLYDVISFKNQLLSHLAIQSNTLDWMLDISVYFPKIRQVVSTNRLLEYDENYLLQNISNTWQSRKTLINGTLHFRFYYDAVSPQSYNSKPEKADQIVEIACSDENLIKMLDDYKQISQGDPFAYSLKYGVITNKTGNAGMISQIANVLGSRELKQSDSFPIRLGNASYMVFYIQSSSFDWAFVDYVPTQQVLQPITENRYLFYSSIILLLFMSVIAAFLLYRHVQIPVSKLVKGLHRIKLGEFSTRIEKPGSVDFEFVFLSFNEMASQIQRLIGTVYAEKLIAHDARLKQMQSQINPHFLYNCLFFISNMANLGKTEAIERMAVNMGDYYKYTTRLEKQDASVNEEVRFVLNYLEIQKLRLNRISFSVEIPDGMRALEIPRLLLQPIVENAVLHGLGPKPEGGCILIAGSVSDGFAELAVEDDGVGILPEKLQEMRSLLEKPMQGGTGYGIWNVNQRLLLRFGEGAGVRFAAREQGGLRVSLVWRIPGMEGEDGQCLK